jgi:Ice-binding-like
VQCAQFFKGIPYDFRTYKNYEVMTMNKLFEFSTRAKFGIAHAIPIRATHRTAGVTGNASLKILSSFLLVASLTHGTMAKAQQQSAVFLGSAGSYSVLAGTTVTNTGPSIINGNLGVWPGTAVTGFGPGVVNGSEDAGDVAAQHAQASLNIAYNDAAARTSVAINPLAGDISGLTLAPGLYKSTSSLSLSGTVTLHGSGVYIIQIASGLTVGTAGTVVLSGGATSDNVFWQVGSSATLGTTANFKGTILALTSISLATGARLDGRALAQHGAVTLDSNGVTMPLGNTVVVVLPPPPPHHRD